MPLTLNVGLSKKLGLPNFASVCASCAVEFEAEHGLLQSDLEAFHRQVQSAYAACRQAVQDELALHKPGGPAANGTANPASSGNGASTASSQAASAAAANGEPNGIAGRIRAQGGQGDFQDVSEKQLIYLQRLARQIESLGVRKLDTVAQKMFGKPVAAISSFQASSLIDTLKAVKGGEVELAAVLDQEAR